MMKETTKFAATVQPALGSNLVSTLFIAPRAQTNIFDLDYQLYLFELLHQYPINRWSHYIGISLAPIAYYSLGLQFGHLDIVFLVIFAGMHLGMVIKNRLTKLVPLVIGLHALLWLIAYTVGQHVFRLDAPWYLHPVFHILFWPLLQTATHSLEEKLPPPWGGEKMWAVTRDLFRGISIRLLVTTILLFPMYIFLELISTPRLFFVIVLKIARLFNLEPEWLQALDGRINDHIKKQHPALALEDFDAVFSRKNPVHQD